MMKLKDKKIKKNRVNWKKKERSMPNLLVEKGNEFWVGNVFFQCFTF